MHTLTRQQVREVERLAIEELGIPGIVLMENAARHVADTVLDVLEMELKLAHADARVSVLCGGGNNGGDGYALARHLHNAGVGVTLFAARPPDELEGDARVNCDICKRMGLPMHGLATRGLITDAGASWKSAHVLVDALLGTGFTGPLRPHMDWIIDRANARRREHRVPVVAIDVPSGLDCDTGQPAEPTIFADVTVTFVAAKVGMVAPAARPYVGRLVVADIGAPPELLHLVGPTLSDE